MRNLKDSEGYKLGYKNAYSREMGEPVDCENPFEPGFYEYDDYYEGFIDGKDDAESCLFKKNN